jgi:hypothetical protein
MKQTIRSTLVLIVIIDMTVHPFGRQAGQEATADVARN